MSSGPTLVGSVSVIIDDVIYFGTYYVQNSIVYVQSQFGDKATHVGGSRPKSIAQLLLSELVRERPDA
jgi:hypothetical protein